MTTSSSSTTRAASARASSRSARQALDAFFDARLGVEPLERDFTGDHLYSLTQTSRAPIKAFLLDQRRVAGVGNIYADEALFRARVHPLRPANKLTRAQCAAIRNGVVDSLMLGLEHKGATIDDFRDPYGVSGSFQDQFLIHLREHEPCVNCGNPVRKLRVAGRGTYVCEKCQPRPRAAGEALTQTTPRRGVVKRVMPARLSHPRRRSRSRLCGRGEFLQAAVAVERDELLVAADGLAVDYDLGERHHSRQTHELRATLGVLGEVDLLVGDPALGEEGLGDAAIAAGLGRVDGDLAHDFRKYSAISGSVKTEGIVLRSIRYGEADRILHLYTPTRGRVSAIAKGVRKAKSRFGGRLEPYFRLDLVLYEGRSDMMTVTSVETVAAHPRLREHGGALDGAARACEAVARIFDDGDPHTGVYHLLANELALLDRTPIAPAGPTPSPSA